MAKHGLLAVKQKIGWYIQKIWSTILLSGESVVQFVAELRHLSEYCDFDRMLDDMIRDRLVCGISDAKVQERLLVESQLTLTKAAKMAQSMELAEQT